jgi:glycosyltransferase involved in cell wall biosynthesis
VNILHVTPYYAPAWAYGGVVRAVTGLSRAQAAAGHRVVVLTTDSLDHHTRARVQAEHMGGVEVVRVRNLSNRLHGALNLPTPVRFGHHVRRLLDAAAIDVVHAHEFRTLSTLRAVAAARRRSTPLVLSPHGTLPHTTGRRAFKCLWDRVLGAWTLRDIAHIVALTTIEADHARALGAGLGLPLDDERIVVVPNGVDPDEFADLPLQAEARRRWGLGDGPVVLFLGRLTERKRPELLVTAFADVVASTPGARLLVAGPDEGSLPRLRAQVAARGLDGHVVFAGLLTGSERLAALAAADVFALPAVGEGLSMAALEAMACGRPVALSTECGIPALQLAGAGMVVASDVRAWADALRVLLRDREMRVGMGRRARTLVEQCYAWPRIVEKLDPVYHRASTSQRRGAAAIP